MTTELAATVVADVRHWLEQAVIGLNLCPFAKATYVKEQVHYAVCGAQTEDEALQAVHDELIALMETPMDERETTLMIFPAMFDDFLYFNDFAGAADDILADWRAAPPLSDDASSSTAPSRRKSATPPTGRRTPSCTCCARKASTVRSRPIPRWTRFPSATSSCLSTWA